MTRKSRSFDANIKRRVVKLVAEQDLRDAQLCQQIDLGETAVRNWPRQVQAEQSGQYGAGKPLTIDQIRIRALQAQNRQ